MNNQVVFNKFAVKSGDNWVADSDLLKRTAGYKVTAEDWNSIFLILSSQADNNAAATKELADSISSQSDELTAHSENISSLTTRVQTLETDNAGDIRSIKVGNTTLSASDHALTLPVDVDTMQSPDNLPTIRAVKDYVEHFSMDSAGFVIDAELSDTSEHALQNKKVKETVDNLQAQITSNLNSIVHQEDDLEVLTDKFTKLCYDHGDLVEKVSSILDSFLSKTYPVGSVYMSFTNTDPGTLFGGTWERLTDRFLLGASGNNDAGQGGGEATHQLTADEIPDHVHTFTTADETTRHAHNIYDDKDNLRAFATVSYAATVKNDTADLMSGKDNKYGFVSTDYGWGASVATEGVNITHSHTGTTNGAGGSQPHNNMPPYIKVYMWRRTA